MDEQLRAANKNFRAESDSNRKTGRDGAGTSLEQKGGANPHQAGGNCQEVRVHRQGGQGSVSVSSDALSSQSNLTDFFGSSKYGQVFLYLTSIRRRAYFV